MRARRLISVMALAWNAALQPATTAAPAIKAQACQLRMAFEQWPPYIYRNGDRSGDRNSDQNGDRNADGAPTGLDFELAQAILKEAGCTLQLLPELPTARRQRIFEQGGLDLMLAASDTPQRRAYARFSLPYRHETVGLFARSDKLDRYRHVGSLDALLKRGLPLLAPKVGWYGNAYARALPALEAGGQLSTFNNFQQGVRMLDAGRADLILGDASALRYEARQQHVAISQLPFSVLRAPVHLMLNKSSSTQADLQRINAAIARLEQQGTLNAIRGRYGE